MPRAGISPRRTTTDVLLDALNRAATARGVYEAEELGVIHDADWPQWYAEHMTRTLDVTFGRPMIDTAQYPTGPRLLGTIALT